ncbi:Kinase similar to eukaryotic-like N-acetylglucosamine kinase [Acidisarcina polymorpha]|uniref:Kinase similar to eukaryotic-like N-acetylglucosamine kinase n=1 Tax=Acidisarcina polymorpha TaxID=2211140 RepID=A0A2Z5G7F3_9BACT|nr:BadF/BadG/BcrA/BcrD ATPase family protein [Acidisarcina polymorpha]AXC14634.1 Kinase similar to eukaryotic-like N-acetylglucosamine kinase [Acidisarcina polymorpha]
MGYFLAVDAGGTKTEFLLADEHRTLATVRTGSIKRLREDEATTSHNLREGVSRLAEMSGIAPEAITRTCVGTSGETVPLVADWLRTSFGALVGGELLILGDVEIALDAAFPGGRGVLVLAGTGSNVAGRTQGGVIVTAGGWGPALADQGSGMFLGHEGLRKGFLAIDQQRNTTLLEKIMAHWKLTSLGELIEAANANPMPNFAQLSPIVVECAAAGDTVAIEVVEQGGQDLAYLAGLVIERIRRLEATASGDQQASTSSVPSVAFAGSILREVLPLREAMSKSLRATYAGIQIHAEAADPIQGALWRARQGNRLPSE